MRIRNYKKKICFHLLSVCYFRRGFCLPCIGINISLRRISFLSYLKGVTALSCTYYDLK